MSLIGDALRKARQETAPAPRPRSSSIPAPWRRAPGAGSRESMALGLLLGVLAAVVGGIVVWLLLGRGVTRRGAGESAGRAPDVAERMIHTRAGGSPSPVRSGTGMGRTSNTAPAAPGGSMPANERNPDRRTGRQGASPARPAGRTTSGEGPQSGAIAPVAPGVGGHRKQVPPRPVNIDAIGEARVGSVKLSLDYIVYRAENPFAQINGEEVHVGTDIAGFIVSKITVNAVVLHGEKGGTVTLRSR